MSVTIFTRSTCAPCKTVKLFLTRKGITFLEKNIDEPANAEEFARVADFPMVPLVLVDDHKVQGLNLSLLSSLLMV
jgi:glutaredoxin